VKNFLTSGQQDVTKILAHRRHTGAVYYASTLEHEAGERHIFSVADMQSSSSSQIPSCLTCNKIERNCSFNDALFSPSADFYILYCLGPEIPWAEIRTADNDSICKHFEIK